ncbi:hypothetical protein Tco_1188322 [Tanacetum coccineum]
MVFLVTTRLKKRQMMDEKIRENLYRLASTRYEDLTRELGFEESVLRKETEEKKREKDDKDYIKEERDLREMALQWILAYMDWTKEGSFSEIESIHRISIEDQEKNVIFFMEFLGLGDGEESEDGKSDVKVEGQSPSYGC